MPRSALRARLVDFAGDPAQSGAAMRVVDDGLLLIDDGRIVARGEYGLLARALGRDEEVTDFSGCLVGGIGDIAIVLREPDQGVDHRYPAVFAEYVRIMTVC